MKHTLALNITLLCLLLSGCVQQTYKRTVRFSVDMSGIPDVTSVGVRGNFQPLNWQKNYSLTDDDGDSVYTGEITFDTPFDFVEVKFVKNENTFELEGKENRRVYFDQKDKVTYNTVFDKEK